ncbi:MAG TPA: AI-2E family transporter, partial [bacterium]|nr:AI-2E family transporter [bacterium]
MISKEKINRFIFDKKGWIPVSFMVIFILCIAFAPTITTILLTALFVAYAIDPMVTFLSKKIKLGRPFSSGMVIFMIVVLILLLLLIVLPGIFRQLYAAFGNFDDLMSSIWEWMESTAAGFNVDISRYLSKDELTGRIESVAGPVVNSASNLVTLVFEQGLGLLSFIFNFAIFIIMTFFMSSRYPQIKVAIFELVPTKKQDFAKLWLSKFDLILSGFIRGQLTVCFVLG